MNQIYNFKITAVFLTIFLYSSQEMSLNRYVKTVRDTLKTVEKNTECFFLIIR